MGLTSLIGQQHLLYTLDEGYALPFEERVVLLNGRFEGWPELLNANVHISADYGVSQVLPLVDFAGEGEPNFQVSELLVKPDLLDQSID